MMTKTFAVLLAAVATALGSSLMAQDYERLEGQYVLSSKTLIDPPANAKKDRVLLWIDGRGAQQIFDAMPAAAKKKGPMQR